jgi:hypothetical protein
MWSRAVFAAELAMSVLGGKAEDICSSGVFRLLTQKRHAAKRYSITSSSALLEMQRHVEAERLGGLEVDRQRIFGRCLHTGKSAGFSPLRMRSA